MSNNTNTVTRKRSDNVTKHKLASDHSTILCKPCKYPLHEALQGTKRWGKQVPPSKLGIALKLNKRE